jgi:transposase-like protein
MKTRTIIRYSESFKLQIVREYENSGISIMELKKKYDIRGGQTISLWIKRYGKISSQLKVIKVETPKEQDRIKALERENKLLKEALSDQTIKAIISESTLEAVANLLGMELEDVKKKFGEKP